MRFLNEIQLQQFELEGYLIVEGILDPGEDIEKLEAEYSEVLNREAQKNESPESELDSGENLPFLERFTTMFLNETVTHQCLDICLPPNFDEDTPLHMGPTVFHRILRNPRILDIVEDLIGPEIYSNAVQHIRVKPPQRMIPLDKQNALITATDWHQDIGVIDAEADNSEVISVWVAVTDATVENGCLVAIPGSHKKGLVQHCRTSPQSVNHALVSIRSDLLDEEKSIPLPVPAGAAIFFQKTLMHAALPNKSDTVRWSFDLRYNPVGQPSGRSWYPGFIARSKKNPESELRDAGKWKEMWLQARSRMVKIGVAGRPFTRWSPDDIGCA